MILQILALVIIKVKIMKAIGSESIIDAHRQLQARLSPTLDTPNNTEILTSKPLSTEKRPVSPISNQIAYRSAQGKLITYILTLN